MSRGRLSAPWELVERLAAAGATADELPTTDKETK
jgi:hypothetical protein